MAKKKQDNSPSGDQKPDRKRIGTVMKSKEVGFYFKFQQQQDKDGNHIGPTLFPITLADGTKIKDGDTMSLYSKKESLQRAVDQGKMSQEKADELSEFLRYDAVYTVKDGGNAPKKSNDNGSDEDSGDVNF